MAEERTYFILSNLSALNRQAVAKEIKNIDVLVELSEDGSPMVRYEVAGNFCAPISTLEKLIEDDDEAVRKMAERTLNVSLCG